MSSPTLKTNAIPPTRRVLLNSGTVPKTRVRLLASNGQAIQPKAAPAPLSPAHQPAQDPAALAAQEEAQRQAQAEYERQLAEYNRQMEEYNKALAEQKAREEEEARRQAEEQARLRAEEEARKKAEAEEAAKAAAQARAAAQAAAEAAAAAAAAAKKAEEEAVLRAAETKGTTHPTAAATSPSNKLKLAVAVPKTAISGKQPPSKTKATASVQMPPAPGKAKAPNNSIAKPAITLPKVSPKQTVAKTPAPPSDNQDKTPANISEEELKRRDAYLQELQMSASALPIWKKPIFYIGLGIIAALGIGCGIYVHQQNVIYERVNTHREYVKVLLRRAQDVNRHGIETLAQAKEKNYEIKCSKKDAQVLLDIIVDPYIKTETGSNLLGNKPEGVAQNASVLLGIAAEQNPEIAKMVFNVLSEQANKISPTLYNWTLQRMALADVPKINSKLKKLANTVAKMPKWPKKSEILADIWQTIGLRVTEKDLPAILKLLQSKETDGRLAKTLSICLDNIQEMMEPGEEKQKLGDELFDKVPEKYRNSVVFTIAKCSSPKAMEHYKQVLEDTKNWKNEENLRFVSAWGDDSIIDYVMQMHEKIKGDKKLEKDVLNIVGTLICQNRDRTDADAKRLIELYSPNAHADTSRLPELISKTDPDSSDYIGSNAPELESLKAERAKLEVIRKEKLGLIKMLASLIEYPWVDHILDEYAKDGDTEVSIEAENAKEKICSNKEMDTAKRAKYHSRDKD